MDVKASLDGIQKTIVIEGEAIYVSVNKNNWMVLLEDLDYFASTLQGVQLRINHGIDVTDVKGLVKKSWRDGNKVLFEAEVSSDPVLLTQIEKKYLTMVSPKVVSDEIVCSLGGGRTRDANMVMVHLYAGAYEIVHKPECVELSIVAESAYPNNTFHPKGFVAAMDESQRKALIASFCKCADKSKCPCGIKSLKSQVRSDLHGLNQLNKKGEKQKMSAEKPEAPVAPEAQNKAGIELTYDVFEKKMTENTSKIMDACKAPIAESASKLESKLETDVKAAVAALVPSPNQPAKAKQAVSTQAYRWMMRND